MNGIDIIKTELIKWARNKNIEIDNDAYVKSMDDNFIVKLSDESLRDLKGGDGSEIKDDKTRTKIFALHSSSALVCNFFEYWRFRDKSALAKALKFNQGIKSLVYEQKLSMGMQGKMPNLDLFMILTDGQAVAIESKFTEWMSKISKKEPFAESYKVGDRWNDVGLPNCQKMVDKIDSKKEKFFYLNAPQLLKHALGLANMHSNKSELIYLYYNIDTSVSEIHKTEIERFKNTLKGELNFKALTYQELFQTFEKFNSEIDSDYQNYLKSRYF
tara:strand:- start:19615 stop:20430 length:816 start_codon:yes stop_codon:yes gene_type:complete